jgi:hypothetical protein
VPFGRSGGSGLTEEGVAIDSVRTEVRLGKSDLRRRSESGASCCLGVVIGIEGFGGEG